MAKKSLEKTNANTGVIIGGCSMLGIGFGMLLHQIPAGTLIGIGVGLLLSYHFKNKS